jgi:thiamine biosynthesis protein ThiS
MVRIRLNGESKDALDGETLEALLARLGLDPRRIVVERNLEIVPRGRYAEVRIEDGDRLEIVHFVGGG